MEQQPGSSSNDQPISSHQRPSESSKQLPQPVHRDDTDEEDENIKQLGDCSVVYLSLQDCLVKTDRNWKSCQKEVQALKVCNQRRNQQK